MLSLRCLPTLPKRSQSLSTVHRITAFILLDLPHQHHPLGTLPPLSSKFVWGPWDAGFPTGEGLSFGGVHEGCEEVGCSLSGGTVPSSGSEEFFGKRGGTEEDLPTFVKKNNLVENLSPSRQQAVNEKGEAVAGHAQLGTWSHSAQMLTRRNCNDRSRLLAVCHSCAA